MWMEEEASAKQILWLKAAITSSPRVHTQGLSSVSGSDAPPSLKWVVAREFLDQNKNKDIDFVQF